MQRAVACEELRRRGFGAPMQCHVPQRPLDFPLYTGAGILYGLFLGIVATNLFKPPPRTTR
jgi:hypothetical protein